GLSTMILITVRLSHSVISVVISVISEVISVVTLVTTLSGTVWSPIVSTTQMNNLQIIQNNALRIATGCTADTNTNHLHQETLVLPLSNHLRLHASQLREKTKLS